MRGKLVALAVVALSLLAASGQANNIASSTMWFQGALTWDDQHGRYTGTIHAIAGTYYVPGGPGTHKADGQWLTPDGNEAVGGFDVYGLEGATAYLDQNGDGDFNDPKEQTTITNHDAYSEGGTWGAWCDPDVPDWNNYELELHHGGTWSVEAFGGDEDTDGANETPYSGTIVWFDQSTGFAYEHGQNWNPEWTWGEENIPLQYPGFAVNVTYDSDSKKYTVTLTPAPEPFSMAFLGSAFVGVLGYRLRKRRKERT